MPRSLGLSIVIEGIRIMIANSETCLIRGRYTFALFTRSISLGVNPALNEIRTSRMPIGECPRR